MTRAKPVEQREHRIRPKLVDIGAYKQRDLPKLRGRYLKNTKLAVVISTIRNNLTKNFVYSEIPIRPDIYIAPDINDHINNTDPIIDYLINEIKK